MTRISFAACFVLLWSPEILSGGPPQPTLTPLVRVVDLNVGESQAVELCDGSTATVKLLDLEETRDSVRSAVRVVQVKVQVNGRPLTLSAGTYHLPVTIAGVQIDCSVTKGYMARSTADRWGLEKDARLRLWPAGSPLTKPGTFGYPLNQRWLASRTWMSNEPIDGGKEIREGIYYHSGLDFGGAEGLDTVLAATDGLVVARGTDVLPGYDDTPVFRLKPRPDVVYVVDARGWFYRYSHLKSINPGIHLGQTVKMGQEIGLLGKEGASGGWSHLHFEIKCRQPSGKWGTQDSYALAFEAYRRQYSPNLVAVARPAHLVWAGEEVVLDGTRSWSVGKTIGYKWIFDDGTTASGPEVSRLYDRSGTYSEILKITDAEGNVDYDFTDTLVMDKKRPNRFPPYIHAAFWPTTGIKPHDPVTFKVRSFYAEGGREVWHFGDGSPPVEVQSDSNADPHAKDGYAVTAHRYEKPGNYIVRVERTDQYGFKAIAHLYVPVDETH